MMTRPPLTFDGHLSNLKNFLRRRVPNVDSLPLIFYDTQDVTQVRVGHMNERHLLRSALKDAAAAEQLVTRLCEEKRSWINLAGEGGLPGEGYLIAIEYGRPNASISPTSINLAGPPLKPDGTVREMANIILLE